MITDDKRWAAVMSRIRQESKNTLANNRKDGVCIVTMHIVVDADGNPIVWTVPNSVRIEPTRSAKEILLSLLTSQDIEQ